MHTTTSESDLTSIAPSSSSPKAYYVESPSPDSTDENEKRSSTNSRTPSDSPYPSLASSPSTTASRISGDRRRWNKHYCNVVDEEHGVYEDEEDIYEDRRCSISLILGMVLGMAFSGACLAVWGASKPYKTQVTVKSLRVHSLYFGEGSDWSGVPTKFITVNCSARVVIHNPATFFGVQVSFRTANLLFSQITVATAQVKNYYQPKNSGRTMWVRFVGQSVPLYGAGAVLVASGVSGGGIPLKLEFEMQSRGHLVGKLVKTKHTRHVLCSLLIDSKRTKEIYFMHNACVYV